MLLPVQTKQESFGSIQDLIYAFVKNKCLFINEEYKNNIYNTIRGALNNGYTYKDIINIITNPNSSIKSIKSLCKNKKDGNDINVLEDKFYYHNQLRMLPPPPVSYYDPNTCEIIQEEVEYFLELKASYTLNDLIDYIRTKDSMKLLTNNIKRLTGAINIELKRFGIDYLLFLIDTTDIIYSNKKKELKSLFEIEDYIKETDININAKRTESVVNGTNKVVLKTRLI